MFEPPLYTAPMPEMMAFAMLAGSSVSYVPLSRRAGTARSGEDNFCVLPSAVRMETDVKETEKSVTLPWPSGCMGRAMRGPLYFAVSIAPKRIEPESEWRSLRYMLYALRWVYFAALSWSTTVGTMRSHSPCSEQMVSPLAKETPITPTESTAVRARPICIYINRTVSADISDRLDLWIK